MRVSRETSCKNGSRGMLLASHNSQKCVFRVRHPEKMKIALFTMVLPENAQIVFVPAILAPCWATVSNHTKLPIHFGLVGLSGAMLATFCMHASC